MNSLCAITSRIAEYLKPFFKCMKCHTPVLLLLATYQMSYITYITFETSLTSPKQLYDISYIWRKKSW